MLFVICVDIATKLLKAKCPWHFPLDGDVGQAALGRPAAVVTATDDAVLLAVAGGGRRGVRAINAEDGGRRTCVAGWDCVVRRLASRVLNLFPMAMLSNLRFDRIWGGRTTAQ